MTIRTAEYPRPNHFLLHLSDTHLLAGGRKLYGSVDSETHLRQVFDELEASGGRPEAIVFTGDLADKGEPDAYARLRAIVEPAAARLGAQVIWVMGNHDDRASFREGLLGEMATDRAVDRVYDVNGLRVITLDSTVPGHHHGEVTSDQLDWLAEELAFPAPHGTILAMHHPPVPSVLDLAVAVELRDQRGLAEEALPEGGAVVVVAHHPDHLGAEAGGGRLDDVAEAGVGIRFALVGEIAGEDDGLRAAARGLQVGEDVAQMRLAVDGSVELPPAGQQVRVADVQEEMVRPRVLGRSDSHKTSIRMRCGRLGDARPLVLHRLKHANLNGTRTSTASLANGSVQGRC